MQEQFNEQNPYYLNGNPGSKLKYIKKPGRKPLVRNIYDRPYCSLCQKNLVAYARSYGKTYLRKYCHSCADKKYKDPEKVRQIALEASRRKYQRKRLDKMKPCTRCNFLPYHSCQMDWDHIDGNHNNNDNNNLQLLCANCHRLKTRENKDYLGPNAYFKFKSCYNENGRDNNSSIILT